MTHGFQQQAPSLNSNVPKSAPSQQHGQKADHSKAVPTRPRRSFEPRPGH
jgi:hypothetical protein